MNGMKQLLTITLLSASLSGWCAADRKNDEITLVMVPRSEDAVRVGMDLASRYPTLLISYKAQSDGSVSLHGWTGQEWVNITKADYLAGNFFRTGPEAALLIESDMTSFPEGLVPPEGWCSSVYRVETSEIRPLLHLLGRYYDFEHEDWKWFAQNYKLPIDAINPNGLNIAWYHKRLTDHLAAQDKTSLNDLQYWVVVREPLPPMKPVDEAPAIEIVQTNITDEAAAEGDGELEDAEVMEAVEELEAPGVNPFSNSVPDAVILGAGEADAEMADEPIAAEPQPEIEAEAEAAMAEEKPVAE